MKAEEKKQSAISENLLRIREVVVNFIVPLIALAVSFVLIIFFIYPMYKSIPGLKADLADNQQLKSVLATKLINLNKMVDFADIVSTDSDLVNKVLVGEDQVPRLLDQINQIADNSGMDVTRLSYSYGAATSETEAATKTQYNSVSVSLGGDMGYEQLIVFMKDIENAARFVSIPNMRYSQSRTKEGEGKLSCTFAVDSPYLMVQSSAVTDEPVNIDISDQKFVDFINMLKNLKYYEFLNPEIPVVKTETPTPTPTPTPAL